MPFLAAAPLVAPRVAPRVALQLAPRTAHGLGALLLAVLLTLVPGCAAPAAAHSDAGAPTAATAITSTHEATAPDGVPIVYDVHGEGPITLVLVHGWCCSRLHWRDHVDGLVADGYRVVALDLPGHGDSGHARDSWSLPGLAADVVAVVDDVGAERVVLVGHSMGGPVSAMAAAQLGPRAFGVIGVDTLQDVGFEITPEMIETFVARFDGDFHANLEETIRGMSLYPLEPELADFIVEQALRVREAPARGLIRSNLDYDVVATFEGTGVPIRCINAALPYETRIALNREHADYDAIIMEDVGHFLMLEQPDEFARHLRTWLDELAPQDG